MVSGIIYWISYLISFLGYKLDLDVFLERKPNNPIL